MHKLIANHAPREFRYTRATWTASSIRATSRMAQVKRIRAEGTRSERLTKCGRMQEIVSRASSSLSDSDRIDQIRKWTAKKDFAVLDGSPLPQNRILAQNSRRASKRNISIYDSAEDGVHAGEISMRRRFVNRRIFHSRGSFGAAR